MKTRHTRFVRSLFVCLCGLGAATHGALLGCEGDDATNANGASPGPGSTTTPDGGGEGGTGNPRPGDAPGAPGNVMAAPTLVTTFAGSGTPGFDDGIGAAATFNTPMGLAVDKGGNVYVADSANNAVRLVSFAGAVSTVAGGGPDAGGFLDDDADQARFDKPAGVAVSDGDVYVADPANDRIRVVTKNGDVTTLLGDPDAGDAGNGPGSGAVFHGPKGLAFVATTLFVADTQAHTILGIDVEADAGVLQAYAGSSTPGFADGSGTAAAFRSPTGLAADVDGTVLIADSENHRIRRLSNGVTTVAGSGTPSFADGTGTAASFDKPMAIAVDATGNVYVADSGNHRIRKLSANGVVTTVAGGATNAFADGPGEAARFNRPTGIGVDAAGSIYVADTDNHRIRKIFTSGPGQLVVAWSLPTSGGAVTGFKVTATAAGQAEASCTTTAALMCTLTGLASGVAYSVSVVAMSGAKIGTPSTPITATPS